MSGDKITPGPFHGLIGAWTSEVGKQVREKCYRRSLDPLHGELYLVFGGMGPPRHISALGTVFLEGDWEDDTIEGLRAASLSETLACYSYTADEFSIPALRELLPERSEGASTCGRCTEAIGWATLPTSDGGTHQILCWSCNGLGWIPKTPWDLHSQEVERFLESSPSTPEMLARARRGVAEDQLDIAVRCSRAVLIHNLEDAEALEILGEANYALGNLRSAVIQFGQLAEVTGCGNWSERAATTYLELEAAFPGQTSHLDNALWAFREAHSWYKRSGVADKVIEAAKKIKNLELRQQMEADHS